MSQTTRVYLITGFLGSGKTTFLNRIIKVFPKDRKLTILMNEFGEIGVDGTLVEGDDIDMMEISRGSIFCVCVKTDFIKGLYELAEKVQPDAFLIESTGVANPSDLKRDPMLPIFNNRFDYKEQFCIIDAAHFLDAYQTYASLEKQIASSTVFIINKADQAGRETIDEIKQIVRSFHPEPVFFETTFADMPLDGYFSSEMKATDEINPSDQTYHTTVLSNDQLEQFVDDLLSDPDLEITPPDRLISLTYRWTGVDLNQIYTMAENLPAGVVRAKGFVKGDDGMFVFHYVMGDWRIEKTTIPEDRILHKNVLVFIGPPETAKGIDAVCSEDHWKSLGVYQPYPSEN